MHPLDQKADELNELIEAQNSLLEQRSTLDGLLSDIRYRILEAQRTLEYLKRKPGADRSDAYADSEGR